MKRFGAFILALGLILTLFAACGTAEEQASPTAAQTQAPAATESVGTEAPEAAESAAPEAETLYGSFDWETPVSLPLTEETVTLSYWFFTQPFMGSLEVDYDTLPFYVEMEARTGVELEMMSAPFFGASEQYNIIISSGDYPDLITSGADYYTGGASKAIEDGILVDFLELEAYMPNYFAYIQQDETRSKIVYTPEGNIAQAYFFVEPIELAGTMIRSDRLAETGLEAPVTYDEYYEVLKALQSLGYGGLWMSQSGYTMSQSLSAGYEAAMPQEASSVEPFLVKGGVVEYSPITDNFRDWLSLMNQWYEEGLIYTDFVSEDQTEPSESVIGDGSVSIWVGQVDNMNMYSNSYGLEIEPISRPRQEAGQVLHVSQNETLLQGGIAISTQCEELEIAARWLDYRYTYDGYILCNFGIEGEGLMFNEAGEPEFTELVLLAEDRPAAAGMVLYASYGGAGIKANGAEMKYYSDEMWAAIDLWSEDMDYDYMMPDIDLMTSEEGETYNALMADIMTYVSENIPQFIMGTRSLEDWDSYVTTIQGMGIDEALSVYQTAYDRYLER